MRLIFTLLMLILISTQHANGETTTEDLLEHNFKYASGKSVCIDTQSQALFFAREQAKQLLKNHFKPFQVLDFNQELSTNVMGAEQCKTEGGNNGYQVSVTIGIDPEKVIIDNRIVEEYNQLMDEYKTEEKVKSNLIVELTEKLDTLTKKYNGLDNENANLKSKIIGLQKKHLNITEENVKAVELRKKVSDLKMKVQFSEGIIENLNRQIASLKNNPADLGMTDEMAQNIRYEIKELRIENANLSGQLNKLNTEIELKSATIKTQKQRLNKLNDKISSLKDQVNQLSSNDHNPLPPQFRNAKASMNTTPSNVELWDFWEWSDTIHWKDKWLIAIAVVGSLIMLGAGSKNDDFTTVFLCLAGIAVAFALVWIFGWWLLWIPVLAIIAPK